MKRTSPQEDSAPATKADIADLRQLLDGIGAKLTEHDHRFDDIDRKLKEHDERFNVFDTQFHQILEMLHGDTSEANNGAAVISLHGRVYRREKYLELVS